MAIYGENQAAWQPLATFKQLTSDLEALLESRGLAERPTMPETWDHFANLPTERQQQTLLDLQAQIDTLASETEEQGDKVQTSWNAIKTLGLKPPSDLFHKIESDDYVEIYDAKGIQVYRNWEFFSLISYSVADVNALPWDELYTRDEAITEQIVKQGFHKGFSGIREVYRLDIPVHEVQETSSAMRWRFHVTFGILAPLVSSSGHVTHVLATSKIKRVNS